MNEAGIEREDDSVPGRGGRDAGEALQAEEYSLTRGRKFFKYLRVLSFSSGVEVALPYEVPRKSGTWSEQTEVSGDGGRGNPDRFSLVSLPGIFG